MPFPKLSSARVDEQVTSILLAKTNEEKNFLADQILPVVPNIGQESGKILSIKNNHFRTYDSKRAVYDESQHRIEFQYSNNDSYQIDYYDLDIYIPQRVIDQVQDPADARRDAGMTLLNTMMLERDRALGALLTSTSVLTNNTTLSGSSQFSDYAGSRPDTVIETARTSVFTKSGREANCILLSRSVFNTLKLHPFFVNQTRALVYVSDEVLVQLLKDNFGFEHVFVGKTLSITTNEGQSESLASVWGNDVVVFYRPNSASLFEPSLGYTFKLAGKDLRASTRRHPDDIGDIERLEMAYQQKILDTDMAYLVKSAV